MAEDKQKILFEVSVESEDGVKSLDSIAAATRRLNQQRRALDLTTAEGSKKFEELTAKINKNNEATKAFGTNLEKQRANVGNYTNSIKDAADQLNIAGVNVGGLTDKLSAGIPVTAAIGAGVSALAGFYISSAAGAKDLESAQTQLSTSFKIISNDLAKLVGADGKGGGLLSSLAFELNRRVFGLGSAVAGSLAASAQQTLKEIELLDLEAKQFAKDQLSLAEQQRRIRDDDKLALDDRLSGARNIESFITARENELVAVQEKKLDQLKILSGLDKDNLDIKIAIKQTEFEIADIREDSEGKRTEALNGIIAIEKLMRQAAVDGNAAIAKSTEEATTKATQVKDEELAKDVDRVLKRIELKQQESELYIDTTEATISEEERLKDEAAVRDAQRVAEDTKNTQIKIQNSKTETEAKLANAKQQFTTLSGFFKLGSKEQKSFALASIATDTAEAIASLTAASEQNPANGFTFGGAGILQFAVGLGRIFANVASAKNLIAGFASGGLTGTRIGPGMGIPVSRSNGDDMLATVKTGEVILNQSHQARLGGASTFARIGVPGFATGGVTGSFETAAASSQSAQSRLFSELKNAFKSQQIVLPMEQFEIKRETIVQLNSTARVI
jgi:hypothetical protein